MHSSQLHAARERRERGARPLRREGALARRRRTYTERLAAIEEQIDAGASLQEVQPIIDGATALRPDERDALEIWAWAWHESR